MFCHSECDPRGLTDGVGREKREPKGKTAEEKLGGRGGRQGKKILAGGVAHLGGNRWRVIDGV